MNRSEEAYTYLSAIIKEYMDIAEIDAESIDIAMQKISKEMLSKDRGKLGYIVGDYS